MNTNKDLARKTGDGTFASKNPSVSVAIVIAVVFYALLQALKDMERARAEFTGISDWAENNSVSLFVFSFYVITSGAVTSGLISEFLKSSNRAEGTLDCEHLFRSTVTSILLSLVATPLFRLQSVSFYDVHVSQVEFSTILFLSSLLVHTKTFYALKALTSNQNTILNRFFPAQLPILKNIQDTLTLGSFDEETRDPKWCEIGLRGSTGNLFVAGVIGSGKSQLLLWYLSQILGRLSDRPALLAIDPKRTFVRELKNIIEKKGMSEHLLWISLEGSVRWNPVWRENLLKNSAFIEIAHTLRLASVNFIGTSGDSKFWEQASFNLIKASLVVNAATKEYFTLRDLYQVVVESRDKDQSQVLIDALTEKEFDQEERFNIESMVLYFKNEWSPMDEKVRTSILATATGFLNEFLEYRISGVLCPARDEVSFTHIKDVIKEGKLVLLNIENDAQARSVGTLLKLQFQEAVLSRVLEKDHKSARYAVLVMDEYQDVATSGGGSGLGDDRFLAKARESKAITIAATQSVASLENAIRNESATRELLQNFRTRILGNTTDPKTVKLFQEPRGQDEITRESQSKSHSKGETLKSKLFGDDLDSRIQVNESQSKSTVKEFAVTAKEFSRLRTFEAFCQVFDGVDTVFRKLYLKPYYLVKPETLHKDVLKPILANAVFWFALFASPQAHSVGFPNACSAISTPQFMECMELSPSPCVCPIPPRPCIGLSYYIPQTFIEVWPHAKDSFFKLHPGTKAQLTAHITSKLRSFGVTDEFSSFSYHARTLAIPFGTLTFDTLPCKGARTDKPCFDVMSEDLDPHWTTGAADLKQPLFLAGSIAPKACILKGSASGVVGEGSGTFGLGSPSCSFPIGNLPVFPPSSHPACTGWGPFFPRSGVVEGASNVTGALLAGARVRSIGAEVLNTVPSGLDEKWQMIYPQPSSCFREGQSAGILETAKFANESGRTLPGKKTGFLFVIWKRVNCCKDIPEAPSMAALLAVLQAACAGLGGI